MTDFAKPIVKCRLRPSAVPTMVAAGNIDFDGCAAVILRNAGTATVNLWDGMYTLDTKETLSLNVTEEGCVLDLPNISVTFDTSSGAVKKLQILLLKKTVC